MVLDTWTGGGCGLVDSSKAHQVTSDVSETNITGGFIFIQLKPDPSSTLDRLKLGQNKLSENRNEVLY